MSLDLQLPGKKKKESQGVTRKTLRSQHRLGLRMVARLAANGAGQAADDWGEHLFAKGDKATYGPGVYIVARMIQTASGDYDIDRTVLFGLGAADEASKRYIAGLDLILKETKVEAPPPPVEDDEDEDEDEDEDAATI